LATKTISLDTEAYGRLKKAKKSSESFSEAIKRLVPEPFDFHAWLKTLQKNRLSEEAIAAIEEQVAERRRPLRRRR
jgi:predicted CopG family antitoxin